MNKIGYDVTFRESFDKLADFRNQIHLVKDVDKFPMILVGNKVFVWNFTIQFKYIICFFHLFKQSLVEKKIFTQIDLVNHRKVSTEEGIELAKKWDIPFFETSAQESMIYLFPYFWKQNLIIVK